MKRQYFYLSFIFSILIFPTLAVADGGMVIWPPPVHLDQTAQNAIVAWNGEEEIIILSNNIKSDSKATVLRIVPLPSNPTEIKEADPNCFEKLVELMNEKLKAIRPIPPGPAPGSPGPPGGIEIIFHEKIGAHDVTVVKVDNIDYFLNWINNFAQDKGLQVKEISQTFRDGVANYLQRQIEYFVFDVIEPEAGEESIKPLIYRFDCDCLYYPLLISGISEISESWAKINLFLITPKEAVLFDPPYSYYRYHWFYSYGFPVEFTEEELQEVSEDLRDLFEGPVKARKASLYDKLNQLTRDLSLYPCHFWNKDLTLGSSGEEVKALQKILINEGVWDSDQKVTGYFGPVTKDALAKFQEKYLGFSSGTGYFDRETREYFKQLSIKLWGQIIYVDADANGANYGSSWADAYNCLQDALADAQLGDEIRVAQGVYKPVDYVPPPPPPPPLGYGSGQDPAAMDDEREATFQLKNGVTVKGGYAGFGEPEPNACDIELFKTILSGDLAGNDVDVNNPWDLLDDPCQAENSYHVVRASGTNETAVLDGFTISGGNAGGSDWKNRSGGGMYNISATPTIKSCTFSGNAATYGGGMFNRNSSSPTLTNCTFSGNSADREGGGMFNVAESSPTLTNCTFNRNLACSGGGMDNSGGSPMLINCAFIANSAVGKYGWGGGMDNYISNPTIINCIFKGNSTADRGGGIAFQITSATIINSIISGNSAGSDGGGIYQLRPPACPPPPPGVPPGPPPEPKVLTITNCTITRNLSAGDGGGMYNGGKSEMTSCIFWGNKDNGGMNESAQIHHYTRSNYCCIQTWTGALGGVGNIGADPCFVSAGYWDANGVWVEGDYHLLPDSLCIDAGDPCYAAEPNETDLDGRPRIIGGRIDMGAYEFNHIPISDAGPDRETYAWIDGIAEVTLDGTNSYDEDGQPLTYYWNWTVDGNSYDANGVSPAIELPVGQHLIELLVNDGIDDSQPDHVVITAVPPMESQLWVFPRVINRHSRQPKILAWVRLPEGVAKDQVDSDQQLILYPAGSEAIRQYIFQYRRHGAQRTNILAFFDKAELMEAVPDNGRVEMQVVGQLKACPELAEGTGRFFYGTDTVRIIRGRNGRRNHNH